MNILEINKLSDSQITVSNDILKVIKEIQGLKQQIVVLKHLPRLGKTYTLLEYLNNSNSLSLYASDIHDQMAQLTVEFDNMWVIKGAAKMCPLLKSENPPFWVKQYFANKKIKRNVPCVLCYRKDCEYNLQFEFPENNAIITIAKESLANKRVYTSYDQIIIDEKIDKANPIEPACPTLNEDVLASFKYGLDISVVYEEIKRLIDNKSVIEEREYLEKLKKDAKFIGSRNVLWTTIQEIQEFDKKTKKLTKDVVPFLANVYSNINWVKKCFEINEFREKFYIPYIHYAFDLHRKHGSNLIIANATFDKSIYNQLENQYKYNLPDIRTTMDYPITNKNSYLLHFNDSKWNCSRTGLKSYGNHVSKIIDSIPRFCNKKGLSNGIITFPEYEQRFNNFEVVDHFVAHRGKNDFDNVDVLVILGTFNIPRIAVLNKYYQISGDYLDKENLKEWKPIDVNGCRISVPEHDTFRDIRLYLLYEEHLQAILRSGAHIKDNRVVIVFGYVPPSAENILHYKTFHSTRQLVNGYLTSYYKIKRKKQNKKAK